MQSTAIEDSHLIQEEKAPQNVRTRVKNLIIDDTVEPKSPRTNGKTNGTSSTLTPKALSSASTLTPRAKKSNYIEIESDEEQENLENDQKLNSQQRKLRSSKRIKN